MHDTALCGCSGCPQEFRLHVIATRRTLQFIKSWREVFHTPGTQQYLMCISSLCICICLKTLISWCCCCLWTALMWFLYLHVWYGPVSRCAVEFGATSYFHPDHPDPCHLPKVWWVLLGSTKRDRTAWWRTSPSGWHDTDTPLGSLWWSVACQGEGGLQRGMPPLCSQQLQNTNLLCL